MPLFIIAGAPEPGYGYWKDFGKQILKTIKRQTDERKENMKLELAILAGDESKRFLAGFTKQIDRLEALSKNLPADSDVDEDETDEDEDEAPKKAKRGRKAAVKADDADKEESEEDDESEDDETDEDEDEDKESEEDDESEDDETDEDEDEDEDEAPKKAKRAKKLTVDDVNDACKARAAAGGKAGRKEVLAILKKKFKTESVSELEPEDYAACIKAMKVDDEE